MQKFPAIPKQSPAPSGDWGFAIVHVASGRRDGNYFREDETKEMFDWWSSEYPDEEFELVKSTGPARPELRPTNANLWRTST